MAPRLAVSLLGQPYIERDGVPVKLDRRKAVALLAYLAVTGESHRRDALVNLLWPEYDASRGRAALRRTLYASERPSLAIGWTSTGRRSASILAPASGLMSTSSTAIFPRARPTGTPAKRLVPPASPPSPRRWHWCAATL